MNVNEKHCQKVILVWQAMLTTEHQLRECWNKGQICYLSTEHVGTQHLRYA